MSALRPAGQRFLAYMRIERWSLWSLLPLLAAGAATSRALCATNSIPVLVVRGFEIAGQKPFPTEALVSSLANYTGTNVGRTQLARAAAEVQREYRERGFPDMTVAIGEEEITNAIVRMTVFHGPVPQILVSGKRYFGTNDDAAAAASAATNP